MAQRARSLLVDPTNYAVGILSTVYPTTYTDESLRGAVASGPEYFGSCFENGDLLMLAMPVSQNWRNTLFTETKNATISISSSADPDVPDPRHTSIKNQNRWDPSRPSWRRGMPSKQRITLFGHFERLTDKEEIEKVAPCYKSIHPDAKHWAPGSKDSPHVAFWTRFVVDKIYRVGGFGDESNIGWIDLDLWHKSVPDKTQKNIETFLNSDKGGLAIETLFGENEVESPFYIQN